MKDGYTKLNALAFGMSMGMVYALAILVMGLAATYFNMGNHFVDMMGEYYVGYTTGLMGSAIGALWGFLDGFFMGFLLAYFYNIFHSCCCNWCRCH